MTSKWDQLQTTLDITFNQTNLLKQAFTHASYRNEHRRPSLEDNERLEFLGDAVLELVVSDYLYKTKPHMPEGELTRFRAAIVCEASLVRFAQNMNFHEYIRLGRGEERSGGRTRPALLADVFEAFIGALYLDQGLPAVQRFAEGYMFPYLQDSTEALSQDFKTTLQEWVQQHQISNLKYQIIEERGPAHSKEFVVQVSVGSEVFGVASGRSKKEAEQRAANQALIKLQQHIQYGRT